MERGIKGGYDEIVVRVEKTIQEVEFEPLKIGVHLKRMVRPDEISSEVRQITELLENEIADALGISK